MKNIIINTPKGKREIGQDQPVFIVAELSANHNQSYEQALKVIDKAVEAGVDAIKIQTYTADTMTIDSDKEYFHIKDNKLWEGQTLYQLYKKAYTPWDWQPKLKEYVEDKGLVLFSTPFDVTAVDFLEEMKVEIYKVASFEVVDIPLLKRIGQTKKPVIMSTGMASLEEIELAVETLKSNGCPQMAILQCVSSYPANAEEMNLKTIPDLVERFKVISGLSDHSLNNEAAIASVGLGASIIEKHLTLDRSDTGPDSAFSLEPDELTQLVNSIRLVEKALGKPNYIPGPSEAKNLLFRKSLFIVKDIKKDEAFTSENIRSIRPGHGLEPKYYEQVLSLKAKQDIERGTPLKWDLIEKKNE